MNERTNEPNEPVISPSQLTGSDKDSTCCVSTFNVHLSSCCIYCYTEMIIINGATPDDARVITLNSNFFSFHITFAVRLRYDDATNRIIYILKPK